MECIICCKNVETTDCTVAENDWMNEIDENEKADTVNLDVV